MYVTVFVIKSCLTQLIHINKFFKFYKFFEKITPIHLKNHIKPLPNMLLAYASIFRSVQFTPYILNAIACGKEWFL